MHGYAVKVLRGRLILVHHPGPFLQLFTPVLIVAEDHYVMPIGFQARPQVILYKIGHLLRGEVHALPVVIVAQRFVLNGDTPDVDPFSFVSVDLFGKEQGPGIVVFGQ